MECRGCKREFTPNPHWRHKWGLCPECKVANSKRIKAKYKQSGKGSLTERRWRANPKKKEIDKKYRQGDNARSLAVERVTRYRAEHPELMDEVRRVGRLYIYRTQGRLKKWWAEKSKNGCMKCGSFERLGIDHIIPRSLGGGDEQGNLQVLCAKCNGEKGVQIISYEDNL